MKGIQIRKEEIKLSLSAEDRILHIENAEDTTKKLLELAKMKDTISTYTNPLHFYTLTKKI